MTPAFDAAMRAFCLAYLNATGLDPKAAPVEEETPPADKPKRGRPPKAATPAQDEPETIEPAPLVEAKPPRKAPHTAEPAAEQPGRPPLVPLPMTPEQFQAFARGFAAKLPGEVEIPDSLTSPEEQTAFVTKVKQAGIDTVKAIIGKHIKEVKPEEFAALREAIETKGPPAFEVRKVAIYAEANAL